MNRLSKLLTIFILAGCSRAPQELVIQPGAEGTMIALGADVDGSIESSGIGFNFRKSGDLTIGVAAGGPQPIEKSDSALFKPASITKLVTTTLALQTLGSDFRYSTKVFVGQQAGDVAQGLTVVANGDPQGVGEPGKTASTDHMIEAEHAIFSEIATHLRELGITRVSAALRLVSADSRRDVALPASGMEDSDHLTCFGAVSQSFNYNWNCGLLRRGQWADPDLQFPLIVGSQVMPMFDSKGRVAQFTVKSGGELALPISNVKPWYGHALLTYLSQNGISTDGVELADGVMPQGSPTFTIQSEPLSKIIEYTNKKSDNYLADALFKTVAARHGEGTDLRVEGQAAIASYVSRLLTAAGHSEFTQDIHLLDGAGLSHDNRVSARSYLALLGQFTHQAWFPVLWNSLPIAGVDGTLKNRMNGSHAVGIVRAKTGTLKGSYQLAGYVPRIRVDGSATEFIPFVILSAVDPLKKEDIFKLQQDIATQLLKLVNQ